jgi:Fur family ferric uptake transcriptional regulator
MPSFTNTHIEFDQYIIKFRDLITRLGLNNSIQREYILKLFFTTSKHLNAEEIAQELKKEFNINISIATIYRILSLLEEMHVIQSLSIENENVKRYELSLKPHHDHLVCKSCGKVVEFYDSELERIQELIALEKEFILQSHHMVLYGVCKSCQKK